VSAGDVSFNLTFRSSLGVKSRSRTPRSLHGVIASATTNHRSKKKTYDKQSSPNFTTTVTGDLTAPSSVLQLIPLNKHVCCVHAVQASGRAATNTTLAECRNRLLARLAYRGYGYLSPPPDRSGVIRHAFTIRVAYETVSTERDDLGG